MFIRNGRATGSVVVGARLDEAEPVAAPEPTPAPEPDPEPVEVDDEIVVEQQGPPQHSDLKAEWVDYAVSQGRDRQDAEALTKQELVDLFGV